MKIVILSELTPRDWIVVQEILKSFTSVTLIHLTPTPGRKRKHQVKGFNSIGKKIFKKIYKIRLRSGVKPYLDKKLNYQKVEFPSGEINSGRGIAFLKELNPDILFTCWAPILKEPVITIPKIAAINAHFGISPDYRGNDTLFWALFKRDFEKVGGCLHYISKGVDSGNILVQVRPSLVKGDGILTLELKTAALLSRAAVQIIETLHTSEILPEGKIQSEKGRNYKSSEKTLAVELKYLVLKTIGFWKVKPSMERVDYFI